jgi:hypothetical protein
MWDFLPWACVLAAFYCEQLIRPDTSAIQAAYERELSRDDVLHDQGLRIIEATCGDSADETFLCQVTFVSDNDPDHRLYFDIVGVARDAGRWQLKSGLCRR